MRFNMAKTDGSATTVAVLLALTLFLPDSVLTEESSNNRVVCYYTNWSVYRPGTAKFSPQNINPYLCTHLIYAFGGFTKENSLKPFDKYQDIEKGGYAKFTGLKTYNKNLKTMLAIGGWNEGSSRFSPMVASPERRKELIRNAIKFLRQNHFDGLDLDWEYPAFRDGGKPRDRDNYAQLVQELREEFDRESQKTGRPRLLLTMAVPAGLEYIDKGYDIPKLNKYLDWMNILSYDYHSAFEPSVNHHSPLYSLTDTEDDEYNFDGDLNIDATIKHYLKSGADREKLVLGIPTYGRSYTLFNPDANEIGAPADGPGEMGDATRENGYLAYYEICENLKNGGWKVVQPNPKAMGPYAYKGNQWVGFDDEQIVRKKSEYVAQMGLGGIMFWAIDNDDFRGACGGKPYPLIEAAKEALLSAPTDNLVVAPKSRTRPNKYSDNEISTRGPVRNSGGPQGGVEEDTTKSNGRKRVRRPNKNTNSNNVVQQQRKPARRTRPRTSTTESTTVSTTTPQWNTRSTTPEPPTTPDPGSDFKCEDEGFFPHPRDCKKYFWCLSSGPSELGIVAHQFTCPSGLYFNKAADSCDYTQNVLCNKKLKKATTTAAPTSASTTTQSTTTTTEYVPVFSTRRPLPKITAATSRTTFLYTTTTTTEPPVEYEDEYEYVDEDEEESTPDSEEDPRVIKELIELIRKAGGIEQLEKYLQHQDGNGTTASVSGITTPATISKTLYERVLSKTGTTNPLFQRPNSRPQYTSITRQRPSTTENEPQVSENPVEETSEKTTQQRRPGSRFRPQGVSKNEDDDGSTKRPGAPEYVTIRRNRPSTSTTESEGLEYVTIRRQNRPQEDTTTSKYTTIVRRRPTTEAEDTVSETEGPNDDAENQTIKQTAEEEDNKKNSLGITVQLPSQEGVIKTAVVDSTASPDFSSTVSSTTERPSTPQLFKPRPFVPRPRPNKLIPSSTTEQPSTTTRKVSQSSRSNPTRGSSRFTIRGRPTTEAPEDEEEYDDSSADINRTFRPVQLEADLSSLTSADIQFGNGKTRRPSRRRPTFQSTTTTTTEKATPDLKTGSRTIPLARKALLANLDTTKNTRRIVRPSPNPTEQSTIPLKVSTAFKIETPKQYSTISRTRPSTINDELTTLADIEDSTGSDTDNSFKITEPETTTTTEQVTARTRKVIKRIRPTTSAPNVEDGTSVETNKAVVRRRPISRDESELKLSESTINDGTRIGINGVAEKVIKRKKIIRKIRPVKKEEDTTEFGSKIGETTIENERTTRKRPRVLEEGSTSTERRPISRRPFSRFTTESVEPEVQIGARFGELESEQGNTEVEKPKTRRVIIRQRQRPTSTKNVEEVTQTTPDQSNFIGETDITTTSEEDISTFSEENLTEDDITTEELTTPTTTTTSKPRSTVAPLTGRSRPPYRPRGRTPTTPDSRSTTAAPVKYRRTRPQSTVRTPTTVLATSTLSTSTTEAPHDDSGIPDALDLEKELVITTTEGLTTTPEESISTVLDEMLKELTTMLDKEEITTTEDRPTFITEAMMDTTPLETTETDKALENTVPEAFTELSTTTESKTTVTTDISTTSTTQTTTSTTTTTTQGTPETTSTRTTRLRISTTQAPTTEASERSTTPKALRKYKPRISTTTKPESTTEENKRSKFNPARPSDQRPRFILRRENKTQENEELKPTRKFIPQGRKLELPKSTPGSQDLDKEAEIEANEPNNEVQENLNEKKNTPFPGRGVTRNYTRKFSNKPVFATTPATTTTTIQPEILARNKQLFSNPRKMNIPIKPTTEESVPTDETSTEPQQLSTLIHVFAELESSSGTETTQIPESTTDVNGDKNKLERLVEVNRIVEVSVEEHLKNKTVPKTKVLNPQIAKVGQINRLTVINVVGGDNNNFATLEDILSGKKIFSSFPSKVSYENITEEISTVPNDQETNLNILNNTLEIIEANKKFEIFSKSNVVDYSPKKVDPIASAILKAGGAPVIDSILTSSSEKTETEATTLTESPTTEDVLTTSSEKSNTVTDDDLIQSANKRVKIRILEPVYSPIVAESFQEIVTTKAKVVEVPQKNQEIRIAPIEVALS